MTGYQSKKAAAQDKLAQPAQEPWPDLTKRDRESYRKGHDAGVAHHKQAVKAALAQPAQRTWVEPTEIEWFNWWRVSPIADSTEAEIEAIGEIAFTKQWAIRMALTAVKKRNA